MAFATFPARTYAIERGRHIGNFSVELSSGIGVGHNRYRIAHAHIREVLLVHIGQDPHRAHVGNGERLGCAGLNDLPGSDEPFDHFAANGRQDGQFRRATRLYSLVRALESEYVERLLAGL